MDTAAEPRRPHRFPSEKSVLRWKRTVFCSSQTNTHTHTHTSLSPYICLWVAIALKHAGREEGLCGLRELNKWSDSFKKEDFVVGCGCQLQWSDWNLSLSFCLSLPVLGGLMGTDLSTGVGTSAGKDGIPTYYSMFPLHHNFYSANNCTNSLPALTSLANFQQNVLFV